MIRIEKEGTSQLVELAAFAAGAYAGWQLAEGQHWAVRTLAALGMGIGTGTVASFILS